MAVAQQVNSNNHEVDNLTEEQVINRLKNEGIKLIKTNKKPDDKFIFNGIRPTIYQIQNVKNSYLYVYDLKV